MTAMDRQPNTARRRYTAETTVTNSIVVSRGSADTSVVFSGVCEVNLLLGLPESLVSDAKIPVFGRFETSRDLGTSSV